MYNYNGVDYQKAAKENIENLFNAICIELVKNNKILLDKANELTKKHIEKMYLYTQETDKEKEFPYTLNPTWEEIKKEFNKLT